MMDLRCDSKKHGVLLDSGLIEVKCDSKFCGHGAGVTVLHRFDAMTGELVDTHMYKDPRKDKSDATDSNPAAVRSA